MVGFDADATVASTSAPPPQPARQAPAQQQYQQAPPAQQYAGQTPPPAAKSSKKSRTGLWIALGALVLIGICLVVFLFYVDANCLWCEITWNLLPGCPYTGACP